MADEKAEPMWDREPILIAWRVKTWEHAALDPSSFGSAKRVRDLRRLLPEALTGDIYARLTQAEALISRWTEPLAPTEARVLRDIDAEDGLTLRAEVNNLFSMKLEELIPDWDAMVRRELSSRIAEVEQRVRYSNSFICGLPKGQFSISYGYEVEVASYNGSLIDIATHRTLLMGYQGTFLHPGPRRDLVEVLFR